MSPRWSLLDPDRDLRFALVGCGRVASRHLEALAEVPDADWVAVCDIDEAACERTAAKLGVRGFVDYDRLLREARPDVVVLATPSGLHPAQTIRAAEAGVHVLTEKPMATRWSDGKRMVRACAEHRTALFVVKQHRYNPVVQRLARAIADDRFGRIFAVQLNLFWTRPQAYYDMAPWRGTWEFDGGAVMNQAIHYVDLLQWLIGPVANVHAFASTLGRRIEVEDTAAVNLQWRSGTLGSMTVTMLTHPCNFEGSITIIGERGTVRLGGVACNRVERWEFAEPVAADEDVRAEEWSDAVYGNGHVPLYQNVVATLRGNPRPVVDGVEGLKSLEIIIAAYRSAQEARRVPLPFDP
jgi:UDP-N-acetyl-2-amino-2-deoxyglucuronate dehydrogenase